MVEIFAQIGLFQQIIDASTFFIFILGFKIGNIRNIDFVKFVARIPLLFKCETLSLFKIDSIYFLLSKIDYLPISK